MSEIPEIVELEIVPEQPAKLPGNGDPRLNGIDGIAVRDEHMQAAAFLAGKLAGVGRELDGDESHSGQIGTVEGRRQSPAVHPWRSEALERLVGTPAHGDVAGFDESDARIQDGLGQIAHVR